MAKLCAICQKQKITENFWICKKCETQYDLAYENGKQKPPLEWPKWARDLYNSEQREGYRVRKKGYTRLDGLD